ncbi:hypothetical protein GCM10023324_55990 [Streptomyces youssoufiensis]
MIVGWISRPWGCAAEVVGGASFAGAGLQEDGHDGAGDLGAAVAVETERPSDFVRDTLGFD